MDIFGIYNITITKSDKINTDYIINGLSKGEINMNNNKITNLAIPTEDTDSTNKLYVDKEVIMKSTQALRLANDNDRRFRNGEIPMLGELNMNNNKITNIDSPTEDTDAANKKYVDDKSKLIYDGRLKGNNTTLILDPIDSKYKFFLIEYVFHYGFNSGLVPIRNGRSYISGYLDGIMNPNKRMELGILEINYNKDTNEIIPIFAYRHADDWNIVNNRNDNDAYYISRIYLI